MSRGQRECRKSKTTTLHVQHTCRVTWCLKLPSISNSTSLFSSKLRQSKTFYRSVFHIKGMLCSLTRLVKSFVLFVFRVSNLAFILRSFQLKTTASANLKVVLKTVCMSYVHTKRLPTATPSIFRAFCVLLTMAGHIM